ncbi:DHA1 family tetracycline resistance protein-like MFS transporter [Catenuloplanes nepalensis]|uniref:DHA1 family tetracycline resistance protein-like MFS transporter n=1 Tax=Catenuloplanes nepalensis TaxID=587533 RepID=A0ABT9MQ12_9ACTN|nr:MFS transporter [Catenuloplanes nepalensis]MDP9793511.1 DHA1 family tetracycline resistance protein-like MFS transporter [Catenuloplanes nepalensis]
MRRVPALSFLLVTVFLDMLGLALIVPIMPALLAGVTGGAASAALWAGVLGSVYGLLQFMVSPLLGRLSDRYGRRPVLLASLTVLGVDWLAHALASGPWTLLLFHALAGAAAGTNAVVNAYLADVTAPEDRAGAYGLVGAAYGLGFMAGPVIGGLLGAVDVRLPFFAAAALSLANVAYGWFVLPESRTGVATHPAPGGANPFTAVAAVLRRPVLGRLALARLCADAGRMIHQSVWTFYVSAQFAWGTAHIGVVMAVNAVTVAVVQTRAAGPLARRLGDRRAAVAGSVLVAASFLGTGLASAPWMLYLSQAVGVLGVLAVAATMSWISRQIGDDEQGAVQGALSGVAAAAEAVVPVTAGAVFGASLAYGMPGLVFVIAAFLAAASALLLARTPDGR